MARKRKPRALATSLTLCAVTIAFWVRSVWRFDAVLLPFGDGYALGSGGGNVWIGRISPSLLAEASADRFFYSSPANLILNPKPYLIQYRVGAGSLQVAVPFWIILTVLSLVSFYLHRARQPKPGLCPACGYDVRATPQRCPECGAEPAP